MFHQGLGLRDGLRFQRGDELWVKNSSILAVKPSWVFGSDRTQPRFRVAGVGLAQPDQKR